MLVSLHLGPITLVNFIYLSFKINFLLCLSHPASPSHSFPTLHVCPQPLQPHPQNKIKFRKGENEKKKKEKSHHGSCSVTHGSRSKLLSMYLYFQVLIQSHWSGSRPLVSATPSVLGPHWDSCCPVSLWRPAQL